MRLKQTLSFGDQIQESEAAWPGHIEFVDWIDEDTIVYCTRSGLVICRELKSQNILWQHQHSISLKYANFSLCRNKRVFAILNVDRDSGPTKRQITIIDCDSGEFLAQLNDSEICKLLGVDHALVTNLALTPVTGKLVITVFSFTFNANGFIIGSDYQQVEHQFSTDRFVQRISVSPNEDRIVMLADKYVVSLLDLPSKQWLFLQGERVYKERLSEEGDSSPGINHVFHDGKDSLIYNQDGGLCGTVYTNSLTDKTVRTGLGPNAHNELDVDFDNERIAITGTGQDITLWNFDGDELAFLPNITIQRNKCIKFSPSFERLAVGSWDNTVSLYELNVKNSPDDPSWSASTSIEFDIDSE